MMRAGLTIFAASGGDPVENVEEARRWVKEQGYTQEDVKLVCRENQESGIPQVLVVLKRDVGGE